MSVAALRVRASGMCCAVGNSTAAATAAMGACLDHFRDSWFFSRGGAVLRCASVWGVDTWGPERMGGFFASVVHECQTQAPFDPANTALLLLVPDLHRPGGAAHWPQSIYAHCVAQQKFHDQSRICPWDGAGLGAALHHARQLLTTHAVQQVLLAGVDSYLNANTINAYLQCQRILADDISDGFIPGEGAGAVLLTLEAGAGLHITGVGVAHEAAHILQNQQANRAEGLTAAIRQAVAECGQPLTTTAFHMSNADGSVFSAGEVATALTRTLEHPLPQYAHRLLAAYCGETGAAAGPLMLAALTHILPEEGLASALLHCGADYGQRCAVIVQWKGRT